MKKIDLNGIRKEEGERVTDFGGTAGGPHMSASVSGMGGVGVSSFVVIGVLIDQ